MKNKKTINQSGNAHTIIIVAVIVILIGFLCAVFFHSVINKNATKPNSQNTKPAVTSNDSSTGSITEDVFNTKLALNYPKSWKVTNSAYKSGAKYKGRDLGTNNYTLQSPDKNFEVQLLVMSGPPSTNYCDEQRDIYELEILDIPKYEKAKLVIVGYFREDNMLSYYAGVMNNNTNNLTKTDSECKIELESNLSINDNVKVVLRILYNYQDPNPNEVNVVNEYEEFMKAKELDSFKEAKEIIQSLHVVQD